MSWAQAPQIQGLFVSSIWRNFERETLSGIFQSSEHIGKSFLLSRSLPYYKQHDSLSISILIFDYASVRGRVTGARTDMDPNKYVPNVAWGQILSWATYENFPQTCFEVQQRSLHIFYLLGSINSLEPQLEKVYCEVGGPEPQDCLTIARLSQLCLSRKLSPCLPRARLLLLTFIYATPKFVHLSFQIASFHLG